MSELGHRPGPGEDPEENLLRQILDHGRMARPTAPPPPRRERAGAPRPTRIASVRTCLEWQAHLDRRQKRLNRLRGWLILLAGVQLADWLYLIWRGPQ